MTEQNKYLNGKIYKLVSNNTNDIYIGSTTKSLEKALIKHKSDYKLYLNDEKKYNSSFDLVKYSDVKIISVEDVPSPNYYTILSRKSYHIKNTPSVVLEKKSQRKNELEQIVDNIKFEKRKEKEQSIYFKCVCGVEINKICQKSHNQTNRHIEYENDYYRARIQDLIDHSMIDEEYNSLLDSDIETLLSFLKSRSESESE